MVVLLGILLILGIRVRLRRGKGRNQQVKTSEICPARTMSLTPNRVNIISSTLKRNRRVRTRSLSKVILRFALAQKAEEVGKKLAAYIFLCLRVCAPFADRNAPLGASAGRSSCLFSHAKGCAKLSTSARAGRLLSNV